MSGGSEHSAEKGYVWTRNARADHDAGHPSGYDCYGYAILPPGERCGHVFTAETDAEHTRACGLHSTGYCNGSCGCPCHRARPTPPGTTTGGA